MPTKNQEKRIRPVIEEVVEEKYEAPVAHLEPAEHKDQVHHHKVEEENVVVPPPMEPVAEEVASDPPSKKESKMNLKVIFVVTILTALVVGFVAGGVYVYFSGVTKPGTAAPTPKSTTTPEPAQTATPKPSATPAAPSKDEISKVSVSVLNGSGKIGEASKVKDLLTAGDIDSVTTGNASRYDYKATVIQFKKEVTPALRSYIEKLVAKSYTVEIDEKDLATSSKTDVVVTVGQE